MINSLEGIRPWGHKGQFGQLNPTPDELTYPPMNISPNKTKREEKESFVSMPMSGYFDNTLHEWMDLTIERVVSYADLIKCDRDRLSCIDVACVK